MGNYYYYFPNSSPTALNNPYFYYPSPPPNTNYYYYHPVPQYAPANPISINSNHPTVNSEVKKTQNYNKSYFRRVNCEVCNINFNNIKQFLKHLNDSHVKCDQEGCSYTAPPEVLEFHKLKHFRDKRGNTIDSKDEVKKWINSRIKKFPRRLNSNPTNIDSSNIQSSDDGKVNTSGYKPNYIIDKKGIESDFNLPNGTEYGRSMNNTGFTNDEVLDDEILEPDSDSDDLKEFDKDKVTVNEKVGDDISILEAYLRKNMANKGKESEKRSVKSILFPYLNKVYKQPSALVRYTNPKKYDYLLTKLESAHTPYTYSSSIPDLGLSRKKLPNKRPDFGKKISYSIPKRPPSFLQLIRDDVERLDNVVVDVIKFIANHPEIF